MKLRSAKRQQGIALLALLAVIMLAASWFLVRQLNVESGRMVAVKQNRNAEVLNRAKLALIGYIAAQAIKAGENNPGALPCPEAAGYFDNPTQDGQTASSCTLPKVGRFPWRTIGTEKLVDVSGEPLWYAVGPGWAYSGTNPTINSNSVGQLTVDGVPNSAVALIIAPGPAITVAASAGCAAWNQVRPTTGIPDWRNYLECENATSPADSAFVTTGPSGSFNDQVLAITVADIMPAIEAAIADRIRREILPALKTVFTPATWGFPAGTLNNPVLPFPAQFSNPGTSNFQGATSTLVTSTYKGLLPFNQTQNCVPATDPRCTTSFLAFSKAGTDAKTAGSGSIRTQSTCTWQSNIYVCTGQYNQPSISLTFSFSVTNVAMGLRALDFSKITCTAVDDVGNGIPMQTIPCSTSVALQSDGSALFTVATSAMPDIATSGWGTYANYMINIDRASVGDHALLSSTDATTGWFVRNEWYRLLYYAVSQSNTTARLAAVPPAERSCTTVGDCLTITNLTPSTAGSALLILAGRSINGTARPSSTLADYLEFGNATGAFEWRTVSASVATPLAQRFNDRIVVVGSN